MRIADAAPGALLQAPASPAGGAGFLRTFGSVQRAYRARRPAALYQIPERQERRRQLEARTERLEKAASSLAEASPRASYDARSEQVQDVEKVATTRQVTTTSEVVTEATPARQVSIAFADPDAKIAANKSALQLRVDANDPKIKIKVGKQGASLNELAELINSDNDNGGRVNASVVNDGQGFRLLIETAETGAGNVLTVTKDDFKDMAGEGFDLIDGSLAEVGQDESSESVTETQLVAGTRRKVLTREIETKQQLDDAEFAARVSEFAAAYNELRSFADEEQLDVGDDFGLVGNDQRVKQVVSALGDLAASFEDRASESGSGLQDLGLVLEEGGRLSVDSEALQAAIANDTTSVIELLSAAEGGLGSDTARSLAPAEPAPTSTNFDLRGLLDSLSTRQGQLESRAGLLEDVVSALSQTPPAQSAPEA